MNTSVLINKVIPCLFVVTALAYSQGASSHTRLKTPIIDENAASHGSNYNDQVISHGCKVEATGRAIIDTIGTVVVFPDGVDSIITVDGEAHAGLLTDFVQNWGSPVTKIQDKNVFSVEEAITDSNGNILGYWAGGAPHLKGGFAGVIPFKTSGVIIEPTSCVKSVTFVVAIADICEVTPVSGFSDATVMLWTPAVGSNFDGPGLNGFDSPATLTVNRSLTELPESCGDGVAVVVKPSATQLNRDMPIKIDNVQVWPQP